MFEVQPDQEQSQTNFHLLSKREIMRWGDGEQKHTMFLCGLFVSFSAKNSVVSQNIEYTRQDVGPSILRRIKICNMVILSSRRGRFSLLGVF